MGFGTRDLFAAGTGCDISGAVLLAQGLPVEPRSLLAKGQMALGYNFSVIFDASRDQARGKIGVAGLVLGFMLQLIGYLASIENAQRGSGWPAVVIAVGIAAGAIAAAWIASR